MSIFAPLLPSITPAFGWVITAAAGITFQCTMTIMAVAPVRYKAFSSDFIKSKLSAEDDEVKKLTGSGIGKGCHPDPGLGRFADKLPLEDWMKLNTAQRAAGNYLEQQTAIITLLMLSGVFHPIFAASTGAVYMVGRYLYQTGMTSKHGVGKRVPGFGICMLCHLALLGCTVFSGLRMTGLFVGFA
mmetsp:Transcript_13057/g.36740  ORF Transcript_13057/g.36740 Transcript_13057/m.36740 type:complete len:186 (-) Transcript_13057:68-625(-)